MFDIAPERRYRGIIINATCHGCDITLSGGSYHDGVK